jgi:hypothetical protein
MDPVGAAAVAILVGVREKLVNGALIGVRRYAALSKHSCGQVAKDAENEE